VGVPLTGYIANTDYDWYAFLRQRQPLDEVNFWKPSGSAFRAAAGMPFIFKLKKPHYAVAGFGHFARYSRYPMSLVWNFFREKNGAADFATMRRLIERYQQGTASPGRFDYEIGCIMVTEPVFFDEGDWIPQPSDWPRHVPPGMRYDLTQGEGRRVWEQCLALARKSDPTRVSSGAVHPGGYGADRTERQRLGQGIFRIAVADAYGRACAVTTEHTLPALEAAHIQRFSEGGPHLVSNGILLRADIHRLFDLGYVTITKDYTFRVSKRIEEVYKNGRSYYPLDGKPIGRPQDEWDRPDRDLLGRHGETVFLG